MKQRRPGEHRRQPENFTAEVRALKQWLGAGRFWFCVAIVAVLLMSLVLAVANDAGRASRATTTSPTTSASSPYPGYEDNSAYVTPGWNNPTNRAEFTELLHQYEKQAGTRFPNPNVLYNIGIDSCIQLRKGRSDRIIADAQRDTTRSQTWAILNAALDVYCRDQQQYRYLVSR